MSDDETTVFWDIRSGRLVRTLEVGHDGRVTQVQLLADGTLLSGSHEPESVLDSMLKRWDPNTGALKSAFLWRNIRSKRQDIRDLIVHPNGQEIYTVGFSNHVATWDVASNKAGKDFRHEARLPDGSRDDW